MNEYDKRIYDTRIGSSIDFCPDRSYFQITYYRRDRSGYQDRKNMSVFIKSCPLYSAQIFGIFSKVSL